jgi:hypothetical protein
MAACQESNWQACVHYSPWKKNIHIPVTKALRKTFSIWYIKWCQLDWTFHHAYRKGIYWHTLYRVYLKQVNLFHSARITKLESFIRSVLMLARRKREGRYCKKSKTIKGWNVIIKFQATSQTRIKWLTSDELFGFIYLKYPYQIKSAV